MFSGIVKAVGRILEQTEVGVDRRITLDLSGASLPPLAVGGSIAINGACVTAVEATADRMSADLSTETLALTNLGRLNVGARVNLETPLKVGDPLDGHLVTGHVDGVGHVVALRPEGRSTLLTIELPADLGRYVARKGSIAVDGVSLTVNAVRNRQFDVNIIPHTQVVTIIGEYRPGAAVNIEVDILARYLERLGERTDERTDEKRRLNLEFLRKHGYAGND